MKFGEGAIQLLSDAWLYAFVQNGSSQVHAVCFCNDNYNRICLEMHR